MSSHITYKIVAVKDNSILESINSNFLPAGVRLNCLGLDCPYRIRPWVSLTFKTEQKVEQFLARITTTTVTAFQSYTEHQPRRSFVKGASDTV